MGGRVGKNYLFGRSLVEGSSALFHLEQCYAEEMVAHAMAEAPHECCGLLVGAQGRVARLYRTRNAENSPYRYNIDPKQLLGIVRQLDEKGWEIMAIYHSHPDSEAYPSPTDVSLACWPESLYIIVSLKEWTQPVIRAFCIAEGKVREEEVRIDSAEG